MKLRHLIASFTLLLPFYVEAQDQHIIDSLNQGYQTAKHDTDKINCLLALGEELIGSDPDTVLIIEEVVLQISERELNKNHPSALHKKYLFCLAEALNNIGYIYNDQGDIPLALQYYNKSLKLREELEDKKGIALFLNNIGYIYTAQGDIPLALECYHKSLKVYEEMEDKKGMATSFNNIANIYHDQGDSPLALQYYNQSLKAYEEVGNKKGVALALNNIGFIYHYQGDITLALQYYNNSLKIREDIGDKNGAAYCLNNIGAIYKSQGDIPMALQFYHKSLTVHEELRYQNGIAGGLGNIADLLIDQGEELDVAKGYASRSFSIGQEIGSVNHMKHGARMLSVIAKRQGDFEEALKMYELQIRMRDSLKNEETQKATIRQQTKYEFEKAQLVKEQNEKEAARVIAEETSRRDNLQYSVILLGLLVLGILVLLLGKLSLPIRVAEGLIFFSFLILFEFVLVLGDPYVEVWTGGAPGLKLLINAGVAALIFPLHSLFETRLKKRLAK